MKQTLYYREGTSDKAYQAEIVPDGELFRVNFAYGRRGSTLTSGTKTAQPVPYDQAEKIYKKLLSEKMAKGYTPGEDGTPYTAENAGQTSGILPQLLNPIDEEEAMRLIYDDGWCAQQKFDGRRMMVRKSGKVEAINRKGLIVGAPEPIIEQVAAIDGDDFVLDGEMVGDIFYVFDFLGSSNLPLEERLMSLTVLRWHNLPNVKSVKTVYTDAGKLELYHSLKAQNAEGIVFKKLSSLYKPGRPASGGDMLKHKFYATASVLVLEQSADKRSVFTGLNKGGIWLNAGKVTIPPNFDVPVMGSVVEVRYLYATENGVLYQPVYLGVREDLDEHACLLSQLKYKGQEE